MTLVFKLAHVNECFLKTLLNDILGVLAITGHALCNPQKFPRVALDQNVESTGDSALGGSDRAVSFASATIVRGAIAAALSSRLSKISVGIVLILLLRKIARNISRWTFSPA